MLIAFVLILDYTDTEELCGIMVDRVLQRLHINTQTLKLPSVNLLNKSIPTAFGPIMDRFEGAA